MGRFRVLLAALFLFLLFARPVSGVRTNNSDLDSRPTEGGRI